MTGEIRAVTNGGESDVHRGECAESAETEVSRVGGYLEIDVDSVADEEWHRVESRVRDLLRASRFRSHAVVATRVSLGDERDSALVVDHFGHSGACDGECSRESAGVYRVFNAEVTVAGDAPTDIMGTYRLDDGIELTLCSVGTKRRGHEDREPVRR